MTDVQFNLQNHLQNMEERIGKKIDAVHTDVKGHTKQIGFINTTQGKLGVQVRWLWGLATSTITAAVVWLGSTLFER